MPIGLTAKARDAAPHLVSALSPNLSPRNMFLCFVKKEGVVLGGAPKVLGAFRQELPSRKYFGEGRFELHAATVGTN